LASGSSDGTVKVWNVQRGQELLSFKAHELEVNGIAFGPDGKRLVSGGYRGVKVWDAQTGQELLTVKGATDQVNSVAISPDGKRLASTGSLRLVQVWDVQTGDEIFSFKGHTGWVSNLAFSPDGTRLASTGNGDGTVRIWDVSTSQKAPMFGGPTAILRSVSVSPDGKRLAATWWGSMPSERAVKVWEARTGRELLSLKGQTGENFLRVVFSPDGKRLAAGIGTRDDTKNGYTSSGQVKVWDVETGRELLTFKGHTAPVVDVAFSPDSTRVVSTSSRPIGYRNSDPLEPGEVKVWDAQSGGELLTLKGQKRFVNAVTYSPDGKRLATLSRDNSVKVWDAQTGQELLSLPVQIRAGGAVAFSPDGKRLASSNQPPNITGPGEAGEIKLWDAQTGEELFTLQGHSSSVTSIVFSSDGKRLASGSIGMGRRDVKVWNAETGEELLTFEKLGGGGVAFSPDGHQLIIAGEGLKIYDATPVLQKP
jgi:WD40 repeat protein